jgi:hypothetical protein
MVGYCLTLLDEVAMWQLTAVIHTRLQPRERVFLAASALRALSEKEYSELIRAMECWE